MHWQSWSHPCSAGFTLRGWHTPPSGKPLLHFLHGNGFCGRTYSPMLERLAEDFDLWLCDIQGHGDSDHGGRFQGWNRSAELALEAFEAGRGPFGEVPRFALGHSFGGVLTSLILARAPQLFQRAVLLDPVLFGPKLIGVMWCSSVLGVHRRRPMVKQALARRAQWADRATAYRGLQGRGIYRGWEAAGLQAFIEHGLKDTAEGQVQLKCPPSREAEIFASFPRRLWSSLAKVRVPTRVLYGETTYPFVSESAARWCARNPQISRQAVPGGHCFMQQDSATAAGQVKAFLQD